jgi:hypothetical protein
VRKWFRHRQTILSTRLAGSLDGEAKSNPRFIQESLRLAGVLSRQIPDLMKANIPTLMQFWLLSELPDAIYAPANEDLDINSSLPLLRVFDEISLPSQFCEIAVMTALVG